MAAEKPEEIVAHLSRGQRGSTSTGALAAYIARACGHVEVTNRIIKQGYRFFAEISEEIPAFFMRRIQTGSSSVTLTLQGGVDARQATPEALTNFSGESGWSVDPFADCRNTKDAERVLADKDYHASTWAVKVTIGVQLYTIDDVAEPIFIAKHPNEFRVIAEELIALGALQRNSCDLCASFE